MVTMTSEREAKGSTNSPPELTLTGPWIDIDRLVNGPVGKEERGKRIKGIEIAALSTVYLLLPGERMEETRREAVEERRVPAGPTGQYRGRIAPSPSGHLHGNAWYTSQEKTCSAVC